MSKMRLRLSNTRRRQAGRSHTSGIQVSVAPLHLSPPRFGSSRKLDLFSRPILNEHAVYMDSFFAQLLHIMSSFRICLLPWNVLNFLNAYILLPTSQFKQFFGCYLLEDLVLRLISRYQIRMVRDIGLKGLQFYIDVRHCSCPMFINDDHRLLFDKAYIRAFQQRRLSNHGMEY